MAESEIMIAETDDVVAGNWQHVAGNGAHVDASSRERGSPPLAARTVLAGMRSLRTGRLTVSLPDGTTRTYGKRGSFAAEMTVHSWRFFGRLLRGADIGAGEAYVDGDWETPDLVALTRLFLANEKYLAPPRAVGLLYRWRDRLTHLLRTNTRTRARRNIHAHYDLSNDFYRLFLDPSMTYSAALFQEAKIGLEAAQHAKYRRLGEWAGLQPGDHVLEIGCGWGGFAEYAAGTLGCRVTGLTLSEEQARFARRRLADGGLDHLVDIRLTDYRDIEGSFDAIVSVEMLEAVGHRYLDTFFSVCNRVVRPGGKVVLQTITIPDQVYDSYRRGTDWIRKYIFPGGHLPSLGAIQASLNRETGLVIDRLDNIGDHYATTLGHWRRRFWIRIDEVRDLGFDERFIRMWDFYLATCEAAFRHRHIGHLQLQLSPAGQGAFRPSGAASSESSRRP